MSEETKITRMATDIKWIKWVLALLVGEQLVQIGSVAMAHGIHP